MPQIRLLPRLPGRFRVLVRGRPRTSLEGINLAQELALFFEPCGPKIVGEVNDSALNTGNVVNERTVPVLERL
jgi:hypothetical protein